MMFGTVDHKQPIWIFLDRDALNEWFELGLTADDAPVIVSAHGVGRSSSLA